MSGVQGRFRAVFISMFVAVAGICALPSVASAHDGVVSKDELGALKQAYKNESSQQRQIEGIARKWTGAWNQGNQKKMHKIDEDLVAWRVEVLEDLREDGISTKEKGVDQGAPAQERLRDLLVDLRDGQPSFDEETAKEGAYKRKAELLSNLVGEMTARVERMKKRYETHKDRYKSQ